MQHDSLTLLVVGSSEPARRLATDTLRRRRGWRVLEASGGREATILRQRAPIDLVVVDDGLSDMTSAELLSSMRRSLPALKSLVLVDAGGRAPRTGASLAKPFAPSELMDTVDALTGAISNR